MQNCIVRDGRIRLDRRYGLTAALSAPRDPRGSGWGKYGTGLWSSQYVQVAHGDEPGQGTGMYVYDMQAGESEPDGSTHVTGWVEVVGTFAAMADGDWWFQQFESYLYGGNVNAGLGRKLIGPGLDGTGNWGLLRLPNTPDSAPTAAQHQPQYEQATFVGSSVSHSPALGVGESATYEATGDRWHLVYNSAGTHSFTITFAAGSKPNWQYRDVLRFMALLTGVTKAPTLTVTEGAYSTDAILWFGDDEYTPHYRMQNIARSNRDAVVSLTFTFTTLANRVDIYIPSPAAFGVWLSIDEHTNPGRNMPTLQPLIYEYTYYDQSTGYESPPSPAITIPANQQNPLGEWRDLTAPATGASGVSHVRFYRRAEEGGATTRYRLASVSNAGTPSWTDKLALDEVRNLPIYAPSILPTTGVTALTAWQNRLAMAVGPLLYIARFPDPLSPNEPPKFEPLAAAYDITDPGRGLTLYVDDRRAEQIVGLAGQDALYIVTDFSVRAIFGSTPDNWRLIRLPGSEGACGVRAWCAYRGGVLVLTPSGRLLYHAVGQASPEEVSYKLRERIGNQGIKALATSGAVVAVRPDGEIEVRSEDGSYLIMDVQGDWRGGTHTVPTHSALFISGYPIRWIGSDAYLYEGGSDDFMDDAGVAVTGYVVTRKELRSREAVTGIFWGASTESTADVDGVETAIYPKVEVISNEGTYEIPKVIQKMNSPGSMRFLGEAFQFKISVDATSVVEEVRVTATRVDPAQHL